MASAITRAVVSPTPGRSVRRPEAARWARTAGSISSTRGRGAPEGADLVGLGPLRLEQIGDAPECHVGVHRRSRLAIARARRWSCVTIDTWPSGFLPSRWRSTGTASRSPTRTRSSSRPGVRPSSTWSGTTSPSGPGPCGVCFERPTVLKRYPDGAEGPFFYQKRVPSGHPPVARDGDGGVPERPERQRAVPRRRRPHPVGGEPGVSRSQPVAGAAERHRSSRRAAGRPRPPTRCRPSTPCGGWRSRLAPCSRSTRSWASPRPRGHAACT